MSEPIDNQWLVDVIANAKKSALATLVEQLFVAPDNEDPDAAAAILDAIEVSLMSITGEVTEAKLHQALQHISELYAAEIGIEWTKIADAILGTLEWPSERAKTPHGVRRAMDNWK